MIKVNLIMTYRAIIRTRSDHVIVEGIPLYVQNWTRMTCHTASVEIQSTRLKRFRVKNMTYQLQVMDKHDEFCLKFIREFKNVLKLRKTVFVSEQTCNTKYLRS